jgi:hypothetical protein
MKEHVLLHLETDPPVRVHQHAMVQYRDDGGWTIIKDLTGEDVGGVGSSGPSQVGSSGEVDKFRITGRYSSFFRDG